MTDEKPDEDRGTPEDQRVDDANAGTLEEPRASDEGGDEQLDEVPDA